MKKIAFLMVAATSVFQFGCSGGSWGVVHDVLAHVLAVGWTADLLNLVP